MAALRPVYRPRMRIRNASWFDHRPGGDARAAAVRSNPEENSERHRSLEGFGSVRTALDPLRVHAPHVRGTAHGPGSPSFIASTQRPHRCGPV